jgi:hypothetical protein
MKEQRGIKINPLSPSHRQHKLHKPWQIQAQNKPNKAAKQTKTNKEKKTTICRNSAEMSRDTATSR